MRERTAAQRGEGKREGVTTGSCAAAAAKAAALVLLGQTAPSQVTIPCPAGILPANSLGASTGHPEPQRLTIPIAAITREADGVRASVIKDAGDDPDITHGHAIEAIAQFSSSSQPGLVQVDGGRGVGRVTKPGLPVSVGEAAINPSPRQQIIAAVEEALQNLASPAALQVRIEVPDGKRLAAKTLNPRLGILGGISILGTRGTVKPFSHGAWKETIRQHLASLAATGQRTAVLTTGGRSEQLSKAALPGVPEAAFLQVGDFLAFALRQAGKHGMVHVDLGLYFGKCLKLAQGIGYTHARAGMLDLAPLQRWCRQIGLDEAAIALHKAHTARHAMEILEAHPQGEAALMLVTHRALSWARHMMGCPENGAAAGVSLLLFDNTNTLLLRRLGQD